MRWRAPRAALSGQPHADARALARPAAGARAAHEHVLLDPAAQLRADATSAPTWSGARSKKSTRSPACGEVVERVVDREVGVAEAHRPAQLAHADAQCTCGASTGSKSRSSRPTACVEAERRDEARCRRRGRGRARRRARESLRDRLAGAVPGARCAAGSTAGRRRPCRRSREPCRSSPRPSTLPARRGELVGDRAEVLDAERVLDHAEDVGVLQEQRAPAEPVERVPERPQRRRRRGR